MTATGVKNVLEVLWDFLALVIFIISCNVEAIFRYFVKPPLKPLDGEVVLITGGANGIGREIALQLAKTKAKIVCWDLDENASRLLEKELKDCDAHFYKVDVSDRIQVEATALKMQQTIGDITILVNNAGIMPCKSFFKHSPQELENLFKVNVFGNFWTLRAFVPKMMEMNRGHIVTLCSAAGLIPVRNLAPYCGSKHAIHGVVEGLKDEFLSMEVPPKINFTTVYPFSCNTGLLTGLKSHTRFPWLVPKYLRPQNVAACAIDGLRRNYEHVYIPGFVQFAGTTAKGLLPKVQRASTNFLQCYVEPTK